MSLARAWRRQIYGAALAAVLIPAAIIGALLVLTGGSLRRISDLGQVFNGPGIPDGTLWSRAAPGLKSTAPPANVIARLASSSALPAATASSTVTAVVASRAPAS